MSTQDEDRQSQGVVWAVLIGAVLLAISLAVGVGLGRTGGASAHSHAAHGGHAAHAHGSHAGHAQGQPATDAADAAAVAAGVTTPAAAAAATGDGASIRVEGGVVKFYFASGSAELAPGAADALADVLKGVATGQTAVISGFHDTTGNRAFNEELAKQRALAVRDMLLTLGAGEDKLSLKKPEAQALDAGNNAEARRVEVRLE